MSEAAEAFNYDPGEVQNTSISKINLHDAAVSVLSKEKSVLDAAHFYNLPILALWNHILNTKEEDTEQILTKQEEKKIARLMREATEQGNQPTMEDFFYTVKSVLREGGRLLKLRNKHIGNDWILGFLDRNKGITLKFDHSAKGGLCLSDYEFNIKKEVPDSSHEETVQKAVNDVNDKGMAFFAAARLHNVCPSYVWDKLNGKRASQFRGEDEHEIADILREAIVRGIDIYKDDVKETMKAILDAKGRSTRFIDNRPSSRWVPAFLSRNPGIFIKQNPTRSTSGERMSNKSKESNCTPTTTYSSECTVSKRRCPSKGASAPASTFPAASNSMMTSISNINAKISSSIISTVTSVASIPHVKDSSASFGAVIQVMSLVSSASSLSHSISPAISAASLPHFTSCGSSSGTISQSALVTSSVTMSYNRPVSASAISSSNSEKQNKEPILPDIEEHNTTAASMFATVEIQEDGKKSVNNDSVFSLLKRLSMMNFSFGEDRVLQFFSYLEHMENVNDMDYDYWRSLILRILPPTPFTNAPPSHNSTTTASNGQCHSNSQVRPTFQSFSHFRTHSSNTRSSNYHDNHSTNFPRRFSPHDMSHANERHQRRYNNHNYQHPQKHQKNHHHYHNLHPNHRSKTAAATDEYNKRSKVGDEKADNEGQNDRTQKAKDKCAEEHGKKIVEYEKLDKKRKRSISDTGDSEEQMEERGAVNTLEKKKKKRKVSEYRVPEEQADERELAMKYKIKEKKEKMKNNSEEPEKEKKDVKKKKKEKKEAKNQKEIKDVNKKKKEKELKIKKKEKKLAKSNRESDEEKEQNSKKKKKKKMTKVENPVIRVEVDVTGSSKKRSKRIIYSNSSDEE